MQRYEKMVGDICERYLNLKDDSKEYEVNIFNNKDKNSIRYAREKDRQKRESERERERKREREEGDKRERGEREKDREICIERERRFLLQFLVKSP